MLCPRCGKGDVSVHYKQILNNKVTEFSLCADCAQAADIPAGAVASPLFELLAGLAPKPPARSPKPLACPACGLAYGEFRESGMLGCAACYEAFSEPLKDLLKHIHGAARHAGRAPPASLAEASRRRAEEAARLRKELDAAIRKERFEEAARLRDRLKGLED